MELQYIIIAVIFMLVIPCVMTFSVCKWICWKFNAKEFLEMYKETSRELRDKNERLATMEYEYDALKELYEARLKQDHLPEIFDGKE